MEIITAKVELWDNSDGIKNAARAARVCKASEKGSDEKLLEICLRDKHLSVFRHWVHYYRVSKHSSLYDKITQYIKYAAFYGECPYVDYYENSKAVYVCTNHNYILDHPEFNKIFARYAITLDDIIKDAEKDERLHYIIRYTFCITTSIKVSRELNRVSPNAICEQSTRYVNFFSKNGDVQVCESLHDNITTAQSVAIYDSLERSCKEYNDLIADGVKPEDARRVLPLDTATKVVYTYSLNEWINIINLRYFETTGKAAPDAKLVIGEVYNALKLILRYDFMGS